MDKSSKKKYIKNKIDEYVNLNTNVKKLYSNIGFFNEEKKTIYFKRP
ncbi:hypothetical protein PFMC_01301 [Plasmodium falciparum CAMP/Malaysia]|nr:hypothetical protein PFMC_01301 [Plasmodium falciparum CAMP/Malaysia]